MIRTKSTSLRGKTSTPTGNVTPEALAAFQKAIAQYGPGGSFGKGVEAQLERGRTRSMASGMNALIGSGLAGTTMAAGLGKKYEEEVVAPTMAGVESQRAQALSSLYASLAGMEQSGFENQAGRSLSASQSANQLGLGYANLQAGQQQAAGQLGLGYAELNARINAQKQSTVTGNNGFRVPTTAPSLFTPAAPTSVVPTATARPKTWSPEELTALNKKLGNKATGF